MEKHSDAKLKILPNVCTLTTPCKESQNIAHGCFDDGKATRGNVVALIKGMGLGRWHWLGSFINRASLTLIDKVQSAF